MKNKGQRRHFVFAIMVIAICSVAAWAYLSLCHVLYENTANKHWQNKRYMARKNNPDNKRLVDSAITLLQTGDLVVRRGDDMTSYMLSRLNKKDQSYSHCGIVVIEEGKAYVYHSIGGEDNPDQEMRRDDAWQWFSPANNHAFAIYRYNFSDSAKTKMVEQVQRYFDEKRMFDMDFDMSTDDRLYCSEMIWKAIRASVSYSSVMPLENDYGKDFTGVDNLYRNAHTRLVCHVRYK